MKYYRFESFHVHDTLIQYLPKKYYSRHCDHHEESVAKTVDIS